MGKLHFIHGCMSASKSSKLITDRYNFTQNGTNVMVIKPDRDTRVQEPIIFTRIGISCPCLVRNNLNWKEILKLEESKSEVYMIDEIHMFKPKDIDSLVVLADDYGKLIFTYGLRVDTFQKMFPTVKRLIEVGAKMHELKTNCQIQGCLSHATHHLRFRDGQVVKSGPQIKIDDGTDEVFKSVCRRHFNQYFYGRQKTL